MQLLRNASNTSVKHCDLLIDSTSWEYRCFECIEPVSSLKMVYYEYHRIYGPLNEDCLFLVQPVHFGSMTPLDTRYNLPFLLYLLNTMKSHTKFPVAINPIFADGVA